MCLEFGSCFGGRRRDDYGRSRSRGNHGNGYWLETAPAYRQPPIVAVHEAGHKAYHDGAPKADHAHAAYLQDQAGGETPPRHPAWHNKVGDGAGNGPYTPRPHEAAAADHRDNAAMDYHYYHPRQSSNLPKRKGTWNIRVCV